MPGDCVRSKEPPSRALHSHATGYGTTRPRRGVSCGARLRWRVVRLSSLGSIYRAGRPRARPLRDMLPLPLPSPLRLRTRARSASGAGIRDHASTREGDVLVGTATRGPSPQWCPPGTTKPTCTLSYQKHEMKLHCTHLSCQYAATPGGVE